MQYPKECPKCGDKMDVISADGKHILVQCRDCAYVVELTPVSDSQSNIPKVVKKYCNYCRKETEHEVVDNTYNEERTGGDLHCKKCGSARLDTIQGFSANLM